jgi:hypothetical protein
MWGRLPTEICRQLLSWDAEALAGVSRQWRGLLGQAWYRERAARLRWQQLRGSLAQLPRYRARAEVLRWGPPHLQEAVDHFAGALETWYTRWVLFTYWSADLWGEGRPAPVQRVLDRLPLSDTKLALSAQMCPTENVVTWWMFTRHWVGGMTSRLPELSAACTAAMTREQVAFAWCAERSLLVA